MSNKINWIPDGAQSVTPRLVFRNSQKALNFYSSIFDAKRVHVALAPDGQKVLHAEMQIGEARVLMADEFPEMGSHAPESSGLAGCSLYYYVEDVDTVFEKAVAAGCTVKMPVSDMFWGDRYGIVVDPFGYQWELATRKENVSQEEMQRRANEMFAHMAPSN